MPSRVCRVASGWVACGWVVWGWVGSCCCAAAAPSSDTAQTVVKLITTFIGPPCRRLETMPASEGCNPRARHSAQRAGSTRTRPARTRSADPYSVGAAGMRFNGAMQEKELRLALVWFGGVSLAGYMHGVSKEI